MQARGPWQNESTSTRWWNKRDATGSILVSEISVHHVDGESQSAGCLWRNFMSVMIVANKTLPIYTSIISRFCNEFLYVESVENVPSFTESFEPCLAHLEWCVLRLSQSIPEHWMRHGWDGKAQYQLTYAAIGFEMDQGWRLPDAELAKCSPCTGRIVCSNTIASSFLQPFATPQRFQSSAGAPLPIMEGCIPISDSAKAMFESCWYKFQVGECNDFHLQCCCFATYVYPEHW